MSGDRRVADARQFAAEPGPRHDVLMPASVLTRWVHEGRRHVAGLLAVVDAAPVPGDEVLAAEVAGAIGAAADAAARLGAVRAVLAGFDWETSDRQYSLELIDGIVMHGRVQARHVQPGMRLLNPCAVRAGAFTASSAARPGSPDGVVEFDVEGVRTARFTGRFCLQVVPS